LDECRFDNGMVHLDARICRNERRALLVEDEELLVVAVGLVRQLLQVNGSRSSGADNTNCSDANAR
jgi:hypothetical protein